jgi:hypothetical protein
MGNVSVIKTTEIERVILVQEPGPGAQGVPGPQGIQGPPGPAGTGGGTTSINVVSPLIYDSTTQTISLQNPLTNEVISGGNF